MRTSFVQFGDVHLGTNQYNSPERFNDFGRAWLWACDYAIEHRAAFVVCTGDLFNRFSINPQTFDQAYAGLMRLRDAGIPIVDIEGNHDRLRYGEERSWLHSLAAKDLLIYLDVAATPDGVSLAPYDRAAARGSFVEIAGCRIIGVRYLGASTSRMIEPLARGIRSLPDDAHTVLAMHAGLEGILPEFRADLTMHDLEPLRERTHHFALGHLHKHYEIEDFIHNGGSLETWSLREWSWTRGLLHVEVDIDRRELITSKLVAPPRRPFVVIRVDVAGCASPRAVAEAVHDRIAVEQSRRRGEAPVVHLVLAGRLRFDQRDLNLGPLLDLCRDSLEALAVLPHEEYAVTEFENEGDDFDGTGAPDGGHLIDRAELEHGVMRQKLAEDARYANAAAAWAKLAGDLKLDALHGKSGADLVETLRSGVERAGGLPGAEAPVAAEGASGPALVEARP